MFGSNGRDMSLPKPWICSEQKSRHVQERRRFFIEQNITILHFIKTQNLYKFSKQKYLHSTTKRWKISTEFGPYISPTLADETHNSYHRKLTEDRWFCWKNIGNPNTNKICFIFLRKTHGETCLNLCTFYSLLSPTILNLFSLVCFPVFLA